MIPLLVFLLACVAIYLGTILAAFSALMRFSLRMIAESTSGSRDLLGAYLEDPPALFFPARVLLGISQVRSGQAAAARKTLSEVSATSAFKDVASLWSLYASSRG